MLSSNLGSKASVSKQGKKSRRLKNSQGSELNYYQQTLMNLDCMKTTDDAESELDFIWTQAKTLELMAMSMLQRQRFFSSSSVYRMTARTFPSCSKTQ